MPTKPLTPGTMPGVNPYLNPGNLPGLKGLVGGASGVIQNELTGMPNPAETRTANAAWGAGAGLPPGTPFLENRGRRLYNSEIENRQRNGIQDLVAFLRGSSGTISATPGQLLDYDQRRQERSTADAMALLEQQLQQSRMQQYENAPVENSYSTFDPLSLYHGYDRTQRRGVNPSAMKFFR